MTPAEVADRWVTAVAEALGRRRIAASGMSAAQNRPARTPTTPKPERTLRVTDKPTAQPIPAHPRNPDHTYDDPESEIRKIEAVGVAATIECQWCRPSAQPIPAAGTAWDLDVAHAASCPVALDEAVNL